MGLYLTTAITSPKVVAVGGVVAGDIVITSPSAGNFYLLMEQYTAALVVIPGSRAYLYQAIADDPYVNNTVLYTSRARAAAGVEEEASVTLTMLNTDCLLYVFLKQRASNVDAGAFVVGTTYEIMVVGTTDFTLIGASASTVGTTFTATGVGAGTGTAAVLPNPDSDDTVDYISIELLSAVPSTGIEIDSILNLMITMMIVVMMMKMMGSSMQ